MAITKTDFINYTRCDKYIVLEEIKKERFTADISYEEYKNEEMKDKITELLGGMFSYDEESLEIDLTEKENAQLKAMMPYYKGVEIEAGKIVTKMFGGESIYNENTKKQESFEYLKNGIRYLCYVDIYNENENGVNIIEVKATTTNKYEQITCNYPKSEKYPILHRQDNILRFKDEINGYPLESEMPLDKYLEKKQKFLDRYDIGKYIYDIAVQRFIIEGEYENSNNEDKLNNIHYYLAVLNAKYIFDGEYIDGCANYKKDRNGNELITLIDVTKITKDYQNIINKEVIKLEERFFNPKITTCPLGKWCERKKTSECKYFQTICGKNIPSKNSSLNYLNNAQGFKNSAGVKIKGLDLINEGYYNLLDVPEEWIKSKKHQIQRDTLRFKNEYVNKDKLKVGLKQISYPIYHLDFETFPCPLPRFKGETPYIQSPFEFSLHIETSEGVCDKLKDNYVFLNKTFGDEREELIKYLIKYIKPGGTMLAQNVSFEKGRIKELSDIFPEYKEKLMEIYDKAFDLLWLLNTKTSLYQELGFDYEEASLFNFYSSDLSGSYSIKKTLPVFSNLSYKDLEVKNGTEAIVVYANYEKMSKEEFNLKYNALIEYCRQDTWAMVVILEALRKLVK